MNRWGRVSGTLLFLVPSLVATAPAQRLTLTLNSGSPVAFPNATEADYDNASINATTGSVAASAPLAFTVDLNSGPPGVNRTSIVAIRGGAAVMGGTKPIGDLQWCRTASCTWTDLTTVNVTVESRPIVRNALNDPWNGSISFRTKLNWANDGPATYTPTIVLTMTLTTP